MKNKNILYEFELRIYPRKIWIAIDCNDDYLNYFFDGVMPLDGDEYGHVYSILAVNGKERYAGVIIRFECKKYMNAANIAHESTHAALWIFDEIGGRVDLKNQEPLSYLVGYIAECLDQVRKGKVKYGKKRE